jgi:hypothetical protein
MVKSFAYMKAVEQNRNKQQQKMSLNAIEKNFGREFHADFWWSKYPEIYE